MMRATCNTHKFSPIREMKMIENEMSCSLYKILCEYDEKKENESILIGVFIKREEIVKG